MTPDQCQQARKLLGWSRVRLHGAASVSENTVMRIEVGLPVRPPLARAVRAALEAAGVEFIAEEGGGVVRLGEGTRMTSDQCRQARKLLGLPQDRLAALAGVSQMTVVNCESGRSILPVTRAVLQAALEAQGVEFTSGDSAGVRLRKVTE